MKLHKKEKKDGRSLDEYTGDNYPSIPNRGDDTLYVAGKMDNIRTYNRILSAQEILELYIDPPKGDYSAMPVFCKKTMGIITHLWRSGIIKKLYKLFIKTLKILLEIKKQHN